MKTMRILTMAILTVVATLVQESCSHKEIVCPGSEMREVTVSFVWDKASGAAPEGMTLYFFPDFRGGKIWRFDIAGRDGGSVEIPTGRYRMAAYNNDVAGVCITGTDSYETIAAEARQSQDGEATVATGMLYGGTVGHLEVTHCGVIYTTATGETKECGKSVVRCHPDSASTEFTVIARDVKGMERVRTAAGLLKGVRQGYLFADGQVWGAETTTAFGFGADASGNGLEARTTAFAKPLCAGMRYELAVAVVRTDGKTFVRKFDVTDQVMNSGQPHSVIITIEGLEIPDDTEPPGPGGDVGGIDVGVDGWDVIEIDLESRINV